MKGAVRGPQEPRGGRSRARRSPVSGGGVLPLAALLLLGCGLEVRGSLDAAGGSGPGQGGIAGQGGSGASGGSGQGGQGVAGAGAQPGCTSFSSCDDGNPCTADLCNAQKSCQHLPDDSLDAPQNGLKDCQRQACQGGQLVSQSDEAEVAEDDGDSCTVEVCRQGQPALDLQDDGTPCTRGAKAGTCVQGACVVECATDVECDDQEPCSDDACVGDTCQYVPNDGATPAGASAPHDCKRLACKGGKATLVPDPDDLPEASDCQVPSCASDGTPMLVLRPDGAPCPQDGAFCREGACVLNQCGDHVRSGQEQCDQEDLDGKTCADLGGFAPGAEGLACTDACTFDLSGCGSVCGNQIVEEGEECDGSVQGGKTCVNYQGPGATGEVTCSGCVLDTTACKPASCDDEVTNGGETDVDCGGPTSCLRCVSDRKCAAGTDCFSAFCQKPPADQALCKVASTCNGGQKCPDMTACVGGSCLEPAALGVPPLAASECPPGWKTDAKGRCYRLFAEAGKRWYEAFRECRRQGANLVTFDDAAEEKSVGELFGLTTPKGYWTGEYCAQPGSCKNKTVWKGLLGETGAEALTWEGPQPTSHDQLCTYLRATMNSAAVVSLQQEDCVAGGSILGYLCERPP